MTPSKTPVRGKKHPAAKALHLTTFGAGMPKPTARADRNLLGGKGAGLAEMTRIGLPVPPGFTLTTEVCTWFTRKGGYPPELKTQVADALKKLEKAMGRTFGGTEKPLLVSVRSGARVSMPGMMDTVLNLGLNHQTVEALAKDSGSPRFAWDAYRRFVSMYSDVVLDLARGDHGNPFEEILEKHKRLQSAKNDTELEVPSLKAIVEEGLDLVRRKTGRPFPSDPQEQLWGAIAAVFGSWDNDRAVAYRRMHTIPDDWGTAVNVQSMVFGNLGEDSGTGVAFTRNPATGVKEFYGEYLLNAQGEDVVAGIRTPQPIQALEKDMPAVYRKLLEIRTILEDRFEDMQDFEFTIERERLFMLQTRTGKRTGTAALRIATDMVKEKRIDPDTALSRLDPEGITQLMSPVFDAKAKARAIREGRILARGLNAGPGAAAGRIAFTAGEAVERARAGEEVLLVRAETSPEDIRGMQAAVGILTQRGGMTSHAALVARQMGKVCVAGCGALAIDSRARTLRVKRRQFGPNDWISIDGSTGEVLEGRLETHASEVIQVLRGEKKPSRDGDDARFRRVMRWADAARRLGVRANADQPDQAALAVALGAEGIGLCRTEHMFFGEEKLPAVQRMILSETEEERRAALAQVLPLQRLDFEGIFRAMGSRPVTIRTLDPPLHEFLPHDREGIHKLALKLGISSLKVERKISHLHESNPMLGFRGCRLTLLFPEILETQVRAVFEAAATVRKEGIRTQPEIMIPLAGNAGELEPHVEMIRRLAAEIAKKAGVKIPFKVGTMIEIPRAALTAGKIAAQAEFFSFGTNDLTQTTLGISRDDAALFLPAYVERGIYDADPFSSLDREGVGRLVRLAVEEGRAARPDLKVGICGEHGGDPRSIGFCHEVGLDYVSCSPYRIPVARIAAAQAALAERT